MQIQVNILSKQELERVHERSLHLLATTGVQIETRKGQRILEEAGAERKGNTNHFCFPVDFVEWAIRAAPKKFDLGARRAGWAFPVNEGECTLCMNGEGTSVIDRESGRMRVAENKDWLEATRIADYEDDIGIYWRTVTPADRGDSMADFVDYTTTVFRNFSKHVQDPIMSADQAPWLLEILQTIFGDRETIQRTHPYSTLLCPQSPLIISEEYTDAYLALKGWNIPVAVMPMALKGATAPASMIGTLIQCNCEVLAALCLIQANEPRTPFLYAPALTLMDPRTGRYFGGGAENAVMNSAAVELARFYGFPVMASAFGTDVFRPSQQGSYERAINTVLPLLTWPDVILGPGLLGGDMILSFEQMLIDLEIYRMVRQVRRGMVTRESKWLDDIIGDVGPGGNYLMEESTLQGVRGNGWYLPEIGVHDSHESWQEAGKPSVMEEVGDNVRNILETHEPEPLAREVEKELQHILSRAQHVEGSYPLV